MQPKMVSALSKELVSIIVSVYNTEAYLPKCLESITRQTYDCLDIVLIDDGSTDSSGAICDSFAEKDSRARVFHQENHGLWAVRNRGQQEALGDYLLFVDSDDYFHDDYVRLLYGAINKDGHQYPMAICGYTRVYGDDGVIASSPDPTYSVKYRDQLIEGFFDGSLFLSLSYNWNKLYRKDYLVFPFQRPYPRCQDMESNLHLLFSKVDHAIFVSNELYFYRIREGQLTKTRDNLLIMYSCICSIFFNFFCTIPESLKQYKQYILLVLYRKLACWKDLLTCDNKIDDLPLVSYYVKRTILAFLFCRGISVKFKIHKIIQLYFTSPFKRSIRHTGKVFITQ